MADIPIRLVLNAVGQAIPAAMAGEILRVASAAKTASASFASTFDEAEKAARKVASSFTAAGTALSVGLTAPILAVGVASVKTAISIESAFAGIRKTVDATEAEFASLKNELLEMTSVMPVTAEELMGIGESAGALGIAKEDISAFTEVVAKLAVTTNLTSEQAANDMARFFNITASGTETFEEMGSALVYLGNTSASTEDEILAMSMRLAKAGETAGMTRPEIMALSTALSDVGINAEAGGSSAARIIIEIQSAARGGGEALQKFAALAGVLPEQFSKIAMANPAQSVQLFADGLARVIAEGGNAFGTLAELGLSEIRVRDAALGLAAAHDKLRDHTANASRAVKENNALQNEANARFETTASQLTILWNNVRRIAEVIGSAFLPAIKSMVAATSPMLAVVRDMAKGFAALPGPVQLVVIGALGMVAAIGPLLILFGQMISGAFAVAGVLVQVGAAMKMLAGFTTVLGGVFAGVPAALASIAGMAVLAGAALVGLWKIFQLGQILLPDVMEMMDPVLSHWSGIFKSIADGFKAMLSKMGASIAPVVQHWLSMFGAIGTGLSRIFHAAIDPIKKWGQSVVTAATDAETALKNLNHAESEIARTIALKKAIEAANANKGPAIGSALFMAPALDDDQKKQLQELQGEIMRLAGAHQGAYASMRADVEANYQKRIQEAKGVVQLVEAAKQLRGLELSDGLEKLNTQLAGMTSDQIQREIADVNTAIANIGGAAKLSAEDLDRIEGKLSKLGDTGVKAAQEVSRAWSLAFNARHKQTDSRAGLTGGMSVGDDELTVSGNDSGANLDNIGGFAATFRNELVRGEIAGQAMTQTLKDVGAAAQQAGKKAQDAATLAQGDTRKWYVSLTDLLGQAQALKAVLGGRLGDLFGGAASMLGGAGALFGDQLDKDGKSLGIGSVFKNLFDGKSMKSMMKNLTTALPAIAALAGPVINAIKGWFEGRKLDKIGKEAGEVLGFAVSREAAKKISDNAKALGISVKDAALLALPDLQKGDMRGSAVQVIDLMKKIKDGTIPAAEGVKALGDSFTKMVDAAKNAGTVGDLAVRTVLRAARATGQMTAEMSAYVAENVALAVSGANKIAAGMSQAFGKEAKERMPTELAGFGANVATLFMASFDAAVKENGWESAVESLKKGYEQLKDALGGDNKEADAILAPFARYVAYLDNEVLAGLLKVASGAKDVLTGLANADYMSLEQFSAAQAVLSTTFEQLKANGMETKDALLALAPSIQAAISAASQFGVPLDENTQKLKEQAEAAGIAFNVDPMLQIRDVLISIAHALGAEIPASAAAGAASVAAHAATAAAAETAAAEQSAAAWETQVGGALANSQAAAVAAAASTSAAWEATADQVSSHIERAVDETGRVTDGFIAAGDMALAFAGGVDAAANSAMNLSNVIANMPDFPHPPGGGDGTGGAGEGPPPDGYAATGAYVPARPGGSRYVVGEGGSGEVIAPVKAILQQVGAGLAAASRGNGDGQPIVIYLNDSKLVDTTLAELKRRTGAGQKLVSRRGVSNRG